MPATTERPNAAAPVQGARSWVLAALSMGAAAIHFAAGPAHVEELGDLGLAFYWAAIFQAGLAVAFVRSRVGGPGTWLTRIAVGGSLAVSGLWLLSRTIGLPLMPGGPEPVGTADAIGTVLQLLTVALLAVRGPALDARVLASRPGLPGRSLAVGALVATIGVIALSATIAVADASAGHDDRAGIPGHGHGAMTEP